MNRDDEYMYLKFMKNRICDTNYSKMLYKQGKINDFKSKAFESNCEIRMRLDNYIGNRCRTKNQSYVNLLQFFQKNFTKIKYRVIENNVSSNRSVFMNTLEDFIHVYIYEPCNLAIQERLHKRAIEFVEERENKRIKNN